MGNRMGIDRKIKRILKTDFTALYYLLQVCCFYTEKRTDFKRGESMNSFERQHSFLDKSIRFRTIVSSKYSTKNTCNVKALS